MRVFEDHMDADDAQIEKVEGQLQLKLEYPFYYSLNSIVFIQSLTCESDPKSLLAEIEKNSSDTKQLANIMQLLLMVPFHDSDAAYAFKHLMKN